MPATGCEHLDSATIKKIVAFRKETNTFDPDFVTYSCLSCGLTGSFPSLDKHFAKTKHEFAVSAKTVYCGQCHDLIYDPALIVRGGRPVSAISSKPVINGIKRKLSESNDGEDDSYLTANTSQRPCGRSGVRGLFNLGETCYMNAVLQMMVHNPLLASYFLGMGHSIHTCPISKEPDSKKEKGGDSDDEDDGDGVASEDKKEQKEQQSCVACGMTEVFSDVTMVDQPIPAHAVNLLFASWKNIPVRVP
jgi:ubiquitin carboxyl-terminal hydrolase 22/27/51